MKKVFLSKGIAWTVIIILVYLDAFLDILAGRGMDNPLWTPVVDKFGSYSVLLLAIVVLAVFYILVKVLSKIVYSIDKTPHAEEILLSALTVVYALFDLWLISVNFFGFSAIKNYRYTIPFLIVAGLIYALWAEHTVKKRKY